MIKTAVEWLIEQMLKEGFFDGNKPLSYTTLDHIQQQAKEVEREQMMELISFVRVHNKMGKNVEDLMQQFEEYKGGEE